MVQLDSRQTVSEVADAGPYVSGGATVGGSYRHDHVFGVLGLALQLDPGWKSRLSFEVSAAQILATDEVYLDRFTSVSRLTEGIVSVGWAPRADRARDLQPFLSVGAFGESDVGWGPWGAAGLAVHLKETRLRFGVSSPVFLDDKLGRAGVTVWVRPERLGALPHKEIR